MGGGWHWWVICLACGHNEFVRRRIGPRVHAPEPPTRWHRSRCRRRRSIRFPPQTNGVGAAFQCLATASNRPMIWPVCSGC